MLYLHDSSWLILNRCFGSTCRWWERHNIPAPKTIYKLKEIAVLGDDGVWRCNEGGPMVAESELWAEEKALAEAAEE